MPNPASMTEKQFRNIMFAVLTVTIVAFAMGVFIGRVTAPEGNPAPVAAPAPAALIPSSEEEYIACKEQANVAAIGDPGNLAPVHVYVYGVHPTATVDSSAVEVELTGNGFRITSSEDANVCGLKVTVGTSPVNASHVYLRPVGDGPIVYSAPADKRMLFVGAMANDSAQGA